MFDTHVHTTFSTDCQMNIERAIERAKALNTGIVITDHMDLNYPDKGKFRFDIDEYFNQYSKYRNDQVLLGLEMGMATDYIEENKEIEKKYDFDYIIGSVHMVDDVDVYQEIFYKEKSKRQAYEQYFRSILDCVKSYHFVDSIGHIDYIARYAKFSDTEIYYKEFSDSIDEILKEIINKGKAIELNTRRIGNKTSAQELMNIYKRYAELGGKIITIGSDAHNVESIGKNFDIAREMVDLCGLKIVYYNQRKPEYIK